MKTRFPFRLLAALTALCLLLSFGAVSVMAEGPETAVEASVAQVPTDLAKPLASGLAFEGGVGSEFKILVMNDFNDGLFPYPAMLKYIEYVVADTQPDLIVLNGDLTRKGVSTAMANWAVIPWVIDLFGSIPYTLTFGDRDALLPVSKNRYLKNYQNRGNCLAFDNAPINNGVANHHLFVYNSPETAAGKSLDDVACNLWFLDSTKNGFYSFQSEWYGSTEHDVIAKETDYVLPSLMFSHLPLPEIEKALPGKGLANGIFNAGMYEMIKNAARDASVLRGNVLAAVSGHHRSALEDVIYTDPVVTDRELVAGLDSFSLRFIQRPGMTFLSCSDTNRETRGATLITLQLVSEAVPYQAAVYSTEDDPETPDVDESILLTPEVPAAAPVVVIKEGDGVKHIPAFDACFNDGGEMTKFYKAGVNWFFGPLSSFIGLICSPFTSKYDVTFKVCQWFGNTFDWMLK